MYKLPKSDVHKCPVAHRPLRALFQGGTRTQACEYLGRQASQQLCDIDLEPIQVFFFRVSYLRLSYDIANAIWCVCFDLDEFMAGVTLS